MDLYSSSAQIQYHNTIQFELGRSVVGMTRQLRHSNTRLLVPDLLGRLSQDATKEAVKKFYNDLYKPSLCLPLYIRQSQDVLPEFITSEAHNAISRMKCGHSPGLDGILPDMLYHAKEELAPLLVILINTLIAGEAIPEKLTDAVVTLLYKKGDPKDIGNFRPISLLNTTFKLLTSMILRRIEKVLEETESTTQTGFRRNYSTLDNIHAIKEIIERSTEYRFHVYIALIDFSKAFDSVEWNAVWIALSAQGVHSSLIDLLHRIYQSSKTSIRVNEDLVHVDIRKGVKQGDSLSPRLFSSVLRLAMDDIEWDDQGLWIDGQQLTSLEYADDLALFATSRTELESMIRKLIIACSTVGLSINCKKSVLLTSCTTTRQPIVIDGNEFSFTDKAMYLGSKISFPLNQGDEIEQRIRCGWLAWTKISNLLTSRRLHISIRRRLFESCITSSVLYGCEAWRMRKKDREKLAVCQRKMERKMVGVTLMDRWRSERIRGITGLKDWLDEADRRKLVWADKVRRMDTDRWAKIVTNWIPYQYASRRPVGKPPTRWRDDLRKRIGKGWWNIPYSQWLTTISQHTTV